jgi:hypothetical protein
MLVPLKVIKSQKYIDKDKRWLQAGAGGFSLKYPLESKPVV